MLVGRACVARWIDDPSIFQIYISLSCLYVYVVVLYVWVSCAFACVC